MRYRPFGATQMQVSEVGFGCARLGGVFQSTTAADMRHTLHAAFEQGITFFDTSDMYCQGESENLLGQTFRGRRADVILASKVGYCLPARGKLVASVKPLVKPIIQRLGIKRESLPSGASGALSQDFSPHYIVRAVEQSLRRLRTDYLDLYQLHSPPTVVLERGDVLAPLEQLQRDGKIRHFGISCETTQDARICLRYHGIASLQIRLNLLDQSALADVVASARAQGVALIARECYAGGLLAKPLDALGLEAIIPDAAERAAKRREIESYARLAHESGRSLAEMALQFVLSVEGVAVALAGIRTDAQLHGNLHHLAASALSEHEYRVLREQAAA